jgi:stress-induced-phosphoprotein 1
MGLDASVVGSADEAAAAMDQSSPVMEEIKKPQEVPKTEEPAEEVSPEEKEKQTKRKESDKLKELGNAAYKKKQFEEALQQYEKAWKADESNIAVLTNKSAVLFEMERFEECIKECEKAIEVGREIFADFKLIAR